MYVYSFPVGTALGYMFVILTHFFPLAQNCPSGQVTPWQSISRHPSGKYSGAIDFKIGRKATAINNPIIPYHVTVFNENFFILLLYTFKNKEQALQVVTYQRVPY